MCSVDLIFLISESLECCGINRQLYLGLVAHPPTRILLKTFATVPSNCLSFLSFFSVFFVLNWRIRISCDIWSLLSDNRIITSYSARSIYVRSLFSTPNERMRGVLSISPCLLVLLFCNPALSPIFDKVDRCAIGFVFMVPHSLGRVRLIYSGFLIDGINPRSHLFWRSFHFNI